MKKLFWFERQLTMGLPAGMLPFYLERLAGTIVRLDAKVKGISDEILSRRLDDKWSVKQNIAHLAEVDEVALKRIDEMTQGISPLSSAVFELKKDYNAQSIQTVLSHFKNNRIDVIERFRRLNDMEIQKSSIHPRLKVLMSPVDLAWFHAEHDDHHLVRMNEIISAPS